ncbi:MAG: hypothetical protein O2954_13960 [bacterium]|nr:hypothetical protein [bacterium]
MEQTQSQQIYLPKFQKLALLVGVVALAACAGGAMLAPEQFYRSYLVGYLFWVGIALGCLALLFLHHLVGGGWSYLIRRQLEAGSRTFPLLAVLFVPVVLGMHELYVWTHADVVAADEVLKHKQAYLNELFFIGRAVVYFLVWSLLSFLLSRWSLMQDRTADPMLSQRMQKLSGPGLLVFALTVTFASVDWVMSLEPHWFSTIYGMIFMIGQGLATLALTILFSIRLSDRKPLSEVMSPRYLKDLGTLMFAFVMLWAYLSFSQYLIIWSGNLPEEIPWYIQRAQGGWQWVALLLLLLHFALPFSLLLSRHIKRRAKVLGTIAGLMLAMRLVDLFWYIAPAFGGHGHGASELHVHWMDVLAPVGIGGIWLWFFIRELNGKALMPLHDPNMEETFAGAEGH